MKILKIFGIVVGIHLFALVLIFANPGCSSTTKKPAAPAAAETTPPTSPTSAATPSVTPAAVEPAATSSAITFNPDTPAAPAPSGGGAGVRFMPTRPGTPVAGTLVSEPVGDITPASTYTVKSGDNLWTIARKNNTTVAQLTAANSLSANANLKPGQKLIIPSKPAGVAAAVLSPSGPASPAKSTDSVAAPSSSRTATDSVKHVVKSGETLGAIARRYGVGQGELAVANNIVDPAKIRPGMELTIPGYSAPGPKSGKSAKSTNGTTKSLPSPVPAIADPFPPQPAPPATPAVPVIKIDDSATPAPKQP